MDTYMDYSSDGESYWGDDDDYTTPDTVLLSLVQSYDWAGVMDRIVSHPDECKAVGVQGRTPLHTACDQDAPAQIIYALLQAYPEASLMVGTSNMNPLHITCSSQHASIQVVQDLLDGGHPNQTSMQDLDGDTPLHAACRCGAPYDVIKLLLKANPSVVDDRDYELLTPLLRLWVRYVVILGDDVIANVRGPSDLKGELDTAWKNTELLLRCAHLGSLGDDDDDGGGGDGNNVVTTTTITTSRPDMVSKPSSSASTTTSSSGITTTSSLKKTSHLPSHYQYRSVHAAATVDCPRSVVKIATIVHPEQLLERDEMGLTPLLIAASGPIYKVRDLSDQGYLLEEQIHGDGDDDDDDNMDGTESFHDGENDSDSSEQPSVIDILIKACPISATIPSTIKKQLPLHVAISSGKRWNEGISTILNVYPEALSQIDPPTGLYPFMLSASVDKPDLSTILELLRKDPSLIATSTTTPTKNKTDRRDGSAHHHHHHHQGRSSSSQSNNEDVTMHNDDTYNSTNHNNGMMAMMVT